MSPRTVFITGASSGLGRGLSLHYTRAGATVHAVARRKAELDALVAEAPEGRILPVVLDVIDSEKLVVHACEQGVRLAPDRNVSVAHDAGDVKPGAGTGARAAWRRLAAGAGPAGPVRLRVTVRADRPPHRDRR